MRELVRYLRRRRRPRWRRWAERLDPWSPRPADYVVASGLCLGLSLAYLAERSYAVELDRRIFRLEERCGSLAEAGDVLAARATALADRARIVSIAQRELGMVVPGPEAFVRIDYVAPPRGGARVVRSTVPAVR